MKRSVAFILALVMLFSVVCATLTSCDTVTVPEPSDTHEHETEKPSEPSETQDSSDTAEHTHTAAVPVSENLIESTCTTKGISSGVRRPKTIWLSTSAVVVNSTLPLSRFTMTGAAMATGAMPQKKRDSASTG